MRLPFLYNILTCKPKVNLLILNYLNIHLAFNWQIGGIMKKILAMMIVLFSATAGGAQTADAYKNQRYEMVKSQIASRGISDPKVLDALRKVPRHEFVPHEFRRFAYADQPLPIGEGQTISQPYIVAYMTEVLNIKPGEKVLEIGTGSGYQAAILAEVDAIVYSIEVIEPLAIRAKSVLESLGYKNIFLKTGDGYQGWEEHAPFDAIMVTCSPSRIPEPLKEQLAEGGRMIIPVGEQNSIQYLYLLEKRKGKIRQQNVMPVRFVPMIDEKGKTY
jgi:protein-L-isoaspartate(D-aspartate) O-methyltransferase